MNILKPCFFLLVMIVFFGCKQDKKYHDDLAKKEVVPQTDALASILNFQKELNEEFKNPEASPLPDRFRKDFVSLDFFEPDTNYIVTAKFMRTPGAMPVTMLTTTNEILNEVVYGVVLFSLNGKNHELELYQNAELKKKEGFEDYLFLPFTDETNGTQTYAGGRYIDLKLPSSNVMTIDFNRAYNPYCAYNKKYSCPIVPSVNTLKTKVLAGVKDFKKNKK